MIPFTLEGMREKGHAIPMVGEWWLSLARSLLANDPRDLRTLGKDLAKHVRRAAFPHTTLSRFANRTLNPLTRQPYPVTFELIRALCAEFSRLPLPIYFARSYEEAVHMQSVAERYDSISLPDEPAPIVPLPRPDDRRRRGKRPAASPEASAAPVGRRRARARKPARSSKHRR